MASSAQAKQFIQRIAPIIQEEARKRGYLVCSPIIAQACIESNFGVSTLGSRWHNYFGMKCGSSWKGKSVNLSTKEEYNSKLVSIRDNFRVYSSMEEGVKGYFDFISVKRYANLKTAKTPKEYLERIKADGYATLSSYVNTNMNCIAKYDLEKWDWNTNTSTITYNPATEPFKLTETLLKKNSKGESVMWVQYKLNEFGYNLEVDGIFGAKTTAAVKDFQKKNKLVVDGIVGKNTIAKLKGVL